MVLSSILVGIIGLFIGSFLNVVNLRFGQWKSIATSRSVCPKCKHTLQWYDLVPVLSFLLLGAKCHHCKKPISWQYPVVEVATGLLMGVVWYLNNPQTTMQIIAVVFLMLFVVTILLMCVEDVKHMDVQDLLFIVAAVFAVLYATTARMNLVSVLLGAVVGCGVFLLLALVSKERWMGWGDVWLSLPIGITLGWQLAAVWLYSTFVIGALVGVGYLLFANKKRKDPIPLIPIMLIAYVCTLSWGEPLYFWYTRTFFI